MQILFSKANDVCQTATESGMKKTKKGRYRSETNGVEQVIMERLID